MTHQHNFSESFQIKTDMAEQGFFYIYCIWFSSFLVRSSLRVNFLLTQHLAVELFQFGKLQMNGMPTSEFFFAKQAWEALQVRYFRLYFKGPFLKLQIYIRKYIEKWGILLTSFLQFRKIVPYAKNSN